MNDMLDIDPFAHPLFNVFESDIPLIERRLFELGYRLEGSLSSLDGQLDAIVDISTGEPVEDFEHLNEEVLSLATAWTFYRQDRASEFLDLMQWASCGPVWLARLREATR